ncbi:MAG: hypothetical protein ACM3SU_09710 [Acidobacteriota bacterium]
MKVKVAASCKSRCGARVEGEVETSSREFIHRFSFPQAGKPEGPHTEFEEVRLATFAPDSKDWFVECPLCGSPIRIDAGR